MENTVNAIEKALINIEVEARIERQFKEAALVAFDAWILSVERHLVALRALRLALSVADDRLATPDPTASAP